jgi:hypothetical protein
MSYYDYDNGTSGDNDDREEDVRCAYFYQKPDCPECQSSKNVIGNCVGKKNAKGNVERWFYKCYSKACKSGNYDCLARGGGWISWDDYIGIDPENPECKCHTPAREDKAGQNSKWLKEGLGFYVCAGGECDY